MPWKWLIWPVTRARGQRNEGRTTNADAQKNLAETHPLISEAYIHYYL